MKHLVSLILAGMPFIAGNVGLGQEHSSTDGQAESGRYAELVKEKGEFRETWVLPGVNPAKYDKVFIWGGQFEYRDVGPARKTRSTLLYTHKREFGISEEDRRKFEEIVREAFVKELARGKQFELIQNIEDIDASTVILRGGLFDIISRIPPEMIGRSDIYLSSLGEATFALELIDAASGSVVALVAERRAVETLNSRTGFFSMETNSATIMSDIRHWAGRLGRRLRNSLDTAITSADAA